jgi:hypothetical protein
VGGEAGADAKEDGARLSALFDPVAGMRAMAEIQAEGLRAASALLDRVLEPPYDGHAYGPRGAAPRTDDGYSALVEAWAELLQRFAAGLARPADSGPTTVPVDTGAVGAPVRVAMDRDEHLARAEVWLHNGTAEGVGPLSLRCGPLTAPDGTLLAAVTVRFDPAEIERMPSRSSRGVQVVIAATEQPRAGVYRGTIQADGAPKLWLPVEVEVGPG